jgi:glycosyltransferase involved in cell wall biosynthesis
MSKKKSKYKYDVSVIVPVYNGGGTIERCISSLFDQKFDKKKFEVVAVDDGSTDDSSIKIKELQDKYSELSISYVYKENGGVSSARNVGIKKAKGKYLLFLDADDFLSEESIPCVYEFFLKNHESIDILVYNLIYTKNGKEHQRSKHLNGTGIYGVDDVPGVTITTINFCVKSDLARKELFNEDLWLHEDEEFAARILIKKRRFGFVQDATYYYFNDNEVSATSTKLSPYHSFDMSMRMYEGLCKKFLVNGSVDSYIQDLIINDLSWKLRSNVLVNSGFGQDVLQIHRLRNLLNNLDAKRILRHPFLDLYHRHYFLSLRDNKPSVSSINSKIVLRFTDVEVHVKSNIIYITRIKIKDNIVISGFFKNYITNYIGMDDVDIYLFDGVSMRRVAKRDSYYSYHRSKTKTNNFIGFDIEISRKRKSDTEYKFFVSILGNFYCVNNIQVSPTSYFSENRARARFFFFDEGAAVVDQGSGSIRVVRKSRSFFLKIYDYALLGRKDVRKALFKFMAGIFKNRIWVYSDRAGNFDNSYLQFRHDVEVRDGIRKYYIYRTKECKRFLLAAGVRSRDIMKFGSFRHKLNYLRAERVFTSFVDGSFYLPFTVKNLFKNYANKYQPNIVYLQHGVLHAQTINYSKELVDVDKVVVSARSESVLFRRLGFQDEDILKFGMPRYGKRDDGFQVGKEIKRILYAPSWRPYLASRDEGNNWIVNENSFFKSKFWKGVEELMKSEGFSAFLKDKGLSMDISLHPIFRAGIDDIGGAGVVKLVDGGDVGSYDLLITDYSSIVYDAVYLWKPVIYFCPDVDEFHGGLGLYSQVSMPMEDGFGLFAKDIHALRHSILRNLDSESPSLSDFYHKYENCFYDLEDSKSKIYDYFSKV